MRGACGGEGATSLVRRGGVARRGGSATSDEDSALSSAFVTKEANHVRVVDALPTCGRGQGGHDHGRNPAPTFVTKTSKDFPDVGKALSSGPRGGRIHGRGVVPHSPSESVCVGGVAERK